MKTSPYTHRLLSSRKAATALSLLLTSVLLGPGALGFGIRNRAAAVTDNVKEVIPFEDFPVPNYCTGEIISETGTITTRYKYIARPGGPLTVQFHYRFKAVGIGDLGNDYIINQESRIRLIPNPVFGVDYTFVDKFVQISKGSDDNTSWFFTYRLFFEEDGTIRLKVIDVNFDCRG